MLALITLFKEIKAHNRNTSDITEERLSILDVSLGRNVENVLEGLLNLKENPVRLVKKIVKRGMSVDYNGPGTEKNKLQIT